MAYKSNIRRITKQLNTNERRALEAIGIFVRGETQVRCPVDTGHLRDSYDYDVDVNARMVRIGTPTEYAPYPELGTSKQKAQPHLRPAYEDNIGRIQKLMVEYLGRGLR